MHRRQQEEILKAERKGPLLYLWRQEHKPEDGQTNTLGEHQEGSAQHQENFQQSSSTWRTHLPTAFYSFGLLQK